MLRVTGTGGNGSRGLAALAPATNTINIWNSIVTQSLDRGFNGRDGANGGINMYNNTAVNCVGNGFYSYGSRVLMKNNLAYNNTADNYNANMGYTGSDYNASDDATQPLTGASNDRLNQNFSFIDVSGGNFHLRSSDTAARNVGVDLSADEKLAFQDDIDGDARPIGSAWDIGADEIDFAESVKLRGDSKLRGDIRFK